MSIWIRKREHLVHDEAQQTELVGRAEDALERLEHGALGGRLADERAPETVAEVDERSLEALRHEEQRGALLHRQECQRRAANSRRTSFREPRGKVLVIETHQFQHPSHEYNFDLIKIHR